MYYTDGFLKEDTYFSQGHIWHLGMKCKKKECLFCCVSERKMDKKQDEVIAVLGKWFSQEMPYALEKGATEIQKELNRFGEWFRKWSGLEKDVKSPVLHLYFQGRIYSSEKEKAVFAEYRGHRGVILKLQDVLDVWKEGDLANGFMEIMGENVNRLKSLEEGANRLKADMLKAMSRGKLEQGYFIMWEDEDDL